MSFDQIRLCLMGADSGLAEAMGRALGEGFRAQHVGNITAARGLLLRLSPVWLSSVLQKAIEEVVDLTDEWEYRRLVELLQELKSELWVFYLDYGMASGNAAIHEAAIDF